ncbi:AmmeMemoRadiSam system protein A [Sideroxydans lithotrophicus]|uniref:AMMECR1 domain protein n=1 Tax=Sideroxydans lithotrophicus (strain ES-1) TaxID=580332 RepID=D5CSY8_SIDLE|nr:AmmeMemoRadiSam system protein A [Sideroxydans lithotrophicus]ADE12074.1 AMMECR1 domain protein [Sideroxydans lithotrophicus ES-1]
MIDQVDKKDIGQDRGKVLLGIARSSIAEAMGIGSASTPHDEWLNEWGATFVTLTQGGELRGCIGTLQAHRPLAEDVRQNALAAAFRDPRFLPLAKHELEATECEVSLLSPAEAMEFRDEHDALSQLRPGIDGIVLEYGRYRSTFLPQVWEQLPQPHRFMAQLKRKAGLPDSFWAEEIRLARYTVSKWRELDLAEAGRNG